VATVVIAKQFNVSDEVTILITSLFLFGYMLGPILWSGSSENYGRRPIIVLTLFCSTVCILGQSLGKNATTILVTRFLGGLFASAPLTIGGGCLVDLWDAVSRGSIMAIFTAAVFIGPIIGPIVGAFIVPSYLGWRWIFWLLMITSCTSFLIALFFLPETYHPVLLQKKAQRFRKADPITNANKYAAFDRQDKSIRSILNRTLFRPFHMLVLEPILVLITLYHGVVYGLIYALFELFPIIFNETRKIPFQYSGLLFIGTGIGTTLGAAYSVWEGRKYKTLIKKWRGFPPPEERLTGTMVGGPLLVISIFWVGWTGAYENVHWIVPELGTIPLGMGISLLFIGFLVSLILISYSPMPMILATELPRGHISYVCSFRSRR
jgi:multidrug resistance protein